jgi:hypothetical protein
LKRPAPAGVSRKGRVAHHIAEASRIRTKESERDQRGSDEEEARMLAEQLEEEDS